MAVRDHEIAASMAGIDVARMRIMSFSVSSFLITAAGAIYAWYLGAAGQDTFTLLFAITFIAIIVIGGEGSLVGTVLGAVVWSSCPRRSRWAPRCPRACPPGSRPGSSSEPPS